MPTASHPKGSVKSKAGPQLHLPEGVSEDLEPKFLLLDPQNLRLLERVESKLHDIPIKLIGQQSIQDELTETFLSDSLFDVKSLETSIVYNGFLKHERLIVTPFDGEKFLVLEGNRRLTAVRNIFATYGPRLAKLRP